MLSPLSPRSVYREHACVLENPLGNTCCKDTWCPDLQNCAARTKPVLHLIWPETTGYEVFSEKRKPRCRLQVRQCSYSCGLADERIAGASCEVLEILTEFSLILLQNKHLFPTVILSNKEVKPQQTVTTGYKKFKLIVEKISIKPMSTSWFYVQNQTPCIKPFFSLYKFSC